MPMQYRRLGALVMTCATVMALPAAATAQATPAAGNVRSDDTPSIKVGATIFTDYTFQQDPTVTDSDDNTVHSNAFNVSRAYVNVTGNISDMVAFRITPDIARETGTGSSLNGSLTFRIKYAFAQVNLDEWMPKGSWVRLGIQQTPLVDYEEGIYRYRFQGTTFVEREGYLTSSDAGASFHGTLPGNYGAVHVGIYNGEGYARPEANSRKALQIRGTLRPFPMAAVVRGLRLTAFYDADQYVTNADRTRFVGQATFEHRFVNAGVDLLRTADRASIAKPKIDGQGESFWITPRVPIGIEGLFRYDLMKPDVDVNAQRRRTIAGVAYWFPHQGSVSAALLLDYERVTARNFVPVQPRQERVAVHALVNF